MKKWAQAVSGVLSLALALECVPFASEVQAAEQRPVLLEDLKATRAFVHAESYVGPGEVIDCNGDGCVDVYDLAKMKSELLESGLPSLTGLTADQWRIHIGENTEVTFTVNVVEIAELKSNAVKLFDEDGKQLAVMYDDGTNGDQIAYDGVYTAKVMLTSDEYRHVKYYAEAEGVQSNTHEITFYRDLTDEECESFTALQEKLAKMQYTEVCDYLSESKEIIRYMKNGKSRTVTYETAYHVIGIWYPASWDDVKIYPNDEPIKLDDPTGDSLVLAPTDSSKIKSNNIAQDPTEPVENASNSSKTDVSSRLQTIQFNTEETSAAPTGRTGPVTDVTTRSTEPRPTETTTVPTQPPTFEQIIRLTSNKRVAPQLEPGVNKNVAVLCPDYSHDRKTEKLNQDVGNHIVEAIGFRDEHSFLGFNWTEYEKADCFSNSKVTLEQMKNLENYSTVILSTHMVDGDLIYSGTADNSAAALVRDNQFMMLGKEKTDPKHPDVTSGVVAIANGHYAVGAAFFKEYYTEGSLNHSIWFLNCSGSADKQMINSNNSTTTTIPEELKNKGAAVIGFTSDASQSDRYQAMSAIFDDLLDKKSLSDAYNNATSSIFTGTKKDYIKIEPYLSNFRYFPSEASCSISAFHALSQSAYSGYFYLHSCTSEKKLSTIDEIYSVPVYINIPRSLVKSNASLHSLSLGLLLDGKPLSDYGIECVGVEPGDNNSDDVIVFSNANGDIACIWNFWGKRITSNGSRSIDIEVNVKLRASKKLPYGYHLLSFGECEVTGTDGFNRLLTIEPSNANKYLGYLRVEYS